jgi:ribosome-interacting GTPase 1
MFPELDVVAVSVLDDESLDRLREAIWRLTGLIRVFLRQGADVDDEPLALDPGATVEDVAHQIHHELAESFGAARVRGPSARFDGQRVGRGHVVLDGDVVEIMR